MGLQEIVVLAISFFVQGYKWVELQFVRLFSTPLDLERKVREIYAKLGVVFVVEDNPTDTKSTSAEAIDEQYVVKNSDFKEILRVRVHDREYFSRAINHATMGIGETYVEGKWDCDNLLELHRRIMKKKAYLYYWNSWNRFLNYIELCLFNLQSVSKAREVARKHYDLGNDLFNTYLDPWMQYSCGKFKENSDKTKRYNTTKEGYWKSADNLNDAQVQKLELIAKKLDLKPGMRVLDIGCGWGGLCKFLAKNYNVDCVGITIATEGADYARDFCAGLSVDIRVMDYREMNEKFDRIVSAGMFEHVGLHNIRTYFQVVHRCLKDDGIFLLHTQGINHKEMIPIEPWVHKYIFPNGYLPSNREITEISEGLFIIEDWHNFGQDYATTLVAWRDKFIKNWPQISHKYGDQFFRMWTYYFNFFAAGFQSRTIHLWHIVFSKDGLENYRAAR